MDTFDLLAKTKLDENSGARTGDRYNYQWSWCLRKLLDLENNNSDYVMIFEHHDDVLICDSEKTDTKVDFYQIKTKPNNLWTQGDLLYRKKQKQKNINSKNNEESAPLFSLSIIAKLLKHSIDFKECARKYYFVTDSRLSRSLCTESQDELAFSSLNEKSRGVVERQIKEELPRLENNSLKNLFFIQNQMSVKEYENSTIGIISRFLNSKVPDVDWKANAFYDQMIGEIKYRSKTHNIHKDGSELITKKSFSHKMFKSYLEQIGNLKYFHQIVSAVNDVLDRNVKQFSTRDSIKRELKSIEADLKNYEKDDLQRLITIINDKMSEYPITEESGYENEWDYACKLYVNIIDEFCQYKNNKPEYVKALILYEYEKSRN